jgi:hypothetical protein
LFEKKEIIVFDFYIVKGSKIFDDNEEYQIPIAQKTCLEMPVKNVCKVFWVGIRISNRQFLSGIYFH